MRFLATIVLLTGVASAQMPRFKAQQIDASLKIGYGVVLVDINADKRPDIVVADKERVIWFENPTWKLRVITEGTTEPDNVCIDAHDIDGDGQLDLAMGAGWKPGNTKDASTLQWLRRGKTLDEPWEMFPIAYDQPTLHRMRFAELDGGGKKVLVTVPLMGRGSTKENNWSEAGAKVQLHRIPDDPTKPDWPAETINQSLHVPHNFQVDVSELLVASYEGVSVLTNPPAWEVVRLSDGDQSNPGGNRGASEIKRGTLGGGSPYIATIEPWHGHQVAVYTRAEGAKEWKRTVIDDQLRWGHAISCADLDGDGSDEIIVGVRDPLPGKAQNGVRVYRATDDEGAKWNKSELDPGGVAVEDLAVADLNGDGKPDIVGVGRQTRNVRIYWNQGD
ncbi:MAG TPA: VCBS repeat-containing protein [Tepidisphaeraceae bacterium]|nr:VCBS repeat-containing protein [Tepidisphaeraceae bacterium]